MIEGGSGDQELVAQDGSGGRQHAWGLKVKDCLVNRYHLLRALAAECATEVGGSVGPLLPEYFQIFCSSGNTFLLSQKK